jgi:ABC-type Zn uptake system ZnuABC Zn-binding protein ZnuA
MWYWAIRQAQPRNIELRIYTFISYLYFIFKHLRGNKIEVNILVNNSSSVKSKQEQNEQRMA